MSTTQPMRNKNDLNNFKNFYKVNKPNIRNYTLITLGLNSALRISDLLNLKWKDVYDDETSVFFKHLDLVEMKTGKHQTIRLNKNATTALSEFRESTNYHNFDDYIFFGRDRSIPLSRSQAYRIIKYAADSLSLDKHISCHSLRKTFGYFAWKNGTSPIVIMSIFNHSSFSVTMRYLGIEQDDKDDAFLNLNL